MLTAACTAASPAGVDVRGITDERIAHAATVPGRAERAADDSIAGRIDGIDIRIRLGRRHLTRAKRKTEHLLGGRHGSRGTAGASASDRTTRPTDAEAADPITRPATTTSRKDDNMSDALAHDASWDGVDEQPQQYITSHELSSAHEPLDRARLERQ